MSIDKNNNNTKPKQRILTNVITGFLGVGKTTVIQHILNSKPDNELWTILVNEFGQIGLDQSFLTQQNMNKTGLFVKQVAGGCMCCTQAPLTQVALNDIIRHQQPDRLLIEPSGLGHLDEILGTLNEPQYEAWLDCRQTLTIVDPRHFADKRYIEHDIFRQQCQLGDVIVANKQDLQQEADIKAMRAYLTEHQMSDKPVFFVANGQVPPESLLPRAAYSNTTCSVNDSSHHHHGANNWHSLSLNYTNAVRFNERRLIAWCREQAITRLKVMVNVEQSGLIINIVDNDEAIVHLDQRVTNCHIELIDINPLDESNLKKQLDQCLMEQQRKSQ